MNHSRFASLLAVLLLLSVSLNAWLFLRPPAPTEMKTAGRTVRAAESGSISGASSGNSVSKEKTETAPEEMKTIRKPHRTEEELAALPEEDLLFGTAHQMNKGLVNAESGGRVTPERLKALAMTEPSGAEKFRIHAVLFLPGDRRVDFGTAEIEPGSITKFERVHEMLYPTSVKIAATTPPGGESFPFSPTTPGDFEVRNAGIVIEVDVSPAAGTLVLGGQVTHRAVDGFARMPGEVFFPIYTTGVSESGAPVDVILTENKVMQPQFSVAETPFLAAATAGQPCRVPVRMAFGQTILELTCTPVE